MTLRSPNSGRALQADTATSLADGTGERWPVVDGIAYLRTGSEDLAAAAVKALDHGDRTTALCLLLAQNDGWWDGPAPSDANLRILIAQRDVLNLRQAMDLLGYGRVATYFAHRWSDPTYLAGLALLDAHWTAPRTAFELGCGIGHHLRELGRLGVAVTAGDVVFSKLWLARHWVAGPVPQLVCFDADAPWPIDIEVDLAFCHDALYFFADKTGVVARLRRCAAHGLLAIAHIHNRAWPNLSSAAAMTLDEVQALFPDAVLYDDHALTLAAASGSVPVQGGALNVVEAFGLVCGPSLQPAHAANGPLLRPADGCRLRRNPLCIDGKPAWPSDRYANEYASRATYRCAAMVPDRAVMGSQWADAAARRELLDLPERW